jgi:Transposase DDE domain.
MSRLLTAQLSFADLQLQSLGIHLDPALQRIADFLEENVPLVELVRQDLERGLKNPNAGRNGIAAAQILRSLTLMRIKNWDYRELRERINDGYTLRCFTLFDSQSVPKHDAFHRAINRLTPETLAAINQAVVQAAVEHGLEDGKKLRVDTTVVETNIHYPTDATLLWDAVRTITRLIGDLHERLPQGVKHFTNRTRSARRRMQAIQRMTARQRERQQTPKYCELIRITEKVVRSAKQAVAAAQRVRKCDVITRAAIDALCEQITGFCKLGGRVIDQTRRRVLQGETVPAEEKLYSIFEPHTDLIKRGKSLKPVEFGPKVFLAESSHGLITDYRVLEGNPVDSDHVPASLEHHQETFQQAPEEYAADRGFYSVENVQTCQDAGVSQVSIPQRGGQRTAEQEEIERSRDFKKGQRFRAGIEGRISVLFRGRGMKRCLLKGRQRFELLVGAAVLANNLLRIADLLDKRKVDQRKSNRRLAAA